MNLVDSIFWFKPQDFRPIIRYISNTALKKYGTYFVFVMVLVNMAPRALPVGSDWVFAVKL